MLADRIAISQLGYSQIGKKLYLVNNCTRAKDVFYIAKLCESQLQWKS